MRVLKRAGKTVLVRPSPDADRKLSGIPPPPKKEKPPKDRSPKWPVSGCVESFHIAAVQRSSIMSCCIQKRSQGQISNVHRSSSKPRFKRAGNGGGFQTKLGEQIVGKQEVGSGLCLECGQPTQVHVRRQVIELGTAFWLLPCLVTCDYACKDAQRYYERLVSSFFRPNRGLLRTFWKWEGGNGVGKNFGSRAGPGCDAQSASGGAKCTAQTLKTICTSLNWPTTSSLDWSPPKPFAHVSGLV